MAKRGARPPGYPFQVRAPHIQPLAGFPLLSLAERQFVVHTLIHSVINSIMRAQLCRNFVFYFSMIFE
jgi:hypothetical protein